MKKVLFVLVCVIWLIDSLEVPLANEMSQSDEEKTLAEVFSGFENTSNQSINHEPLTQMLRESVLPLGRSIERVGPQGKTRPYLNSKIAPENTSPLKIRRQPVDGPCL